jgi:hypothetical protein
MVTVKVGVATTETKIIRVSVRVTVTTMLTDLVKVTGTKRAEIGTITTSRDISLKIIVACAVSETI